MTELQRTGSDPDGDVVGSHDRSPGHEHAGYAAPAGPSVSAPVSGGPLFEQHMSPMLLTEPDTRRIVGANPAAVDFYGWSVAELTGLRLDDITTGAEGECEREVAAARAEQRAYSVFHHRVADGGVRDVETYSNLIEIDGHTLLATIIHEGAERHRAIHDLHASEAFAQAIVDFAPLGIAVADLDGRILRVNAAMARVTGYAEEELLGMDVHELTAAGDRAEAEALLDELHAGQRDAYRVEQRYRRPDDSIVEVEAWTTLVRDGHGEVSFQLGVVRDLTEQRLAAQAAERAAERLALTMEAVQDAIFVVDRDWSLTYVNGRFEEALKVTRAEVIGRQLWEVFPAAVGTAFEHAYRRALETGQDETVVEHYAPTDNWFEARAYPGPEGLVVYFSDVTERVEQQERLERIAAIERTNADRYRQLDETKTAFLTAVSHELRTPLAVVSGLAETLVRLRGSLDPQVRERIEDGLLHNGHRLTRMLDELLDVDRLSRGTLQMHRVEHDVAELVRTTVAASAVAHRCEVTVPARLVASVDAVQFEHLLGNLLSNADKYAPQGRIAVTVEERGSDRLRLTVADAGPGIPEQDRQRVFEPFVRLHADHPQPGTGVGLTLVAEFARLHGGRAWIDDGPGTTVVVDIPRG